MHLLDLEAIIQKLLWNNIRQCLYEYQDIIDCDSFKGSFCVAYPPADMLRSTIN